MSEYVSISNIRISDQSLIKGNCHNSRTGDDVGKKLGSVTKFDKRIKAASKKFDDDIISQILTSLQFLQFTVNLDQSGTQISEV